MAIIRNNLALKGASGRLGNLVLSQRNGKTVLSVRRGESRNTCTERQQEVLSRFSRCSLYAKTACRDPFTKAAYQEVAPPGKSAYHMAMKDAFHGPEILSIDKFENMIVIEAVDNFKVKSVTVAVYDERKELIEEGNALIEQNEIFWKYVLTERKSEVLGVELIVTAIDLPGNITEATINM